MIRSEMETLRRAASAAALNLRFSELIAGKSTVLRVQQEILDTMKVEELMGANKKWPGYQTVESLNPIYASPTDQAN